MGEYRSFMDGCQSLSRIPQRRKRCGDGEKEKHPGADSAPGWTSLPSPLKNSLNVRNRRSIFPSRMVPRLRARSERVGQAKGEALRVRFPDHGAVFDRAAQERHLPPAEQFPLLREAVVDGEATYGAKPEPGA